jgi:hypothetical protein
MDLSLALNCRQGKINIFGFVTDALVKMAL